MKHNKETIEKRKVKWQSFIKKEITNRELKKEKEMEIKKT